MIKFFSLLLMVSFLSSCAGFVGGDLRGIKLGERGHVDSLPAKINDMRCSQSPKQYVLKITSDAKDDYGGDNVLGRVSTRTLGLIPTYWLKFVDSQATISKDGETVYVRDDKSRVHVFYGLLWRILPTTRNSLVADEGLGLRVESGIKYRAVAKTLAELPQGLKLSDLCVL